MSIANLIANTPQDRELKLYELEGDTRIRRIARMFPTGWTPVGHRDGRPRVAAHGLARAYRGTAAILVGSMLTSEAIRAEVDHPADAWEQNIAI